MEQWTTDIWRCILEEACVPDDGVTGPSLSLTSRHVHVASKEYHVQSLCLWNQTRIQEYAELLAPLGPQLAPAPGAFQSYSHSPHRFAHVRHLFLQTPAWNPEELGRAEDLQWEQVLPLLKGSKMDGTDPFITLVRIFTVFANMHGCRLSLLAALCDTGDYRLGAMAWSGRAFANTGKQCLRLRFPAIAVSALPSLVELTIMWEQFVSEMADLSGLRRLSVLFSRIEPRPCDNVFATIRERAPKLTHLRLTPVLLDSGLVDIFIEEAMAGKVKIPRTLQRLVLETMYHDPMLVTMEHMNGEISSEERNLIILRTLAKRTGSSPRLECRLLPDVDPIMVLLNEPLDAMRTDPERLQEWRERAYGWDGCWAEPGLQCHLSGSEDGWPW